MNRKIVALFIWLALTALYVFNLTDMGRSMGANTNSAIENYVEYYTQEYVGAEGVAEALTNSWSYSEFNNLEKKFKGDFMVIGITTSLYILVSIACYHHAFIRKNKVESKEES